MMMNPACCSRASVLNLFSMPEVWFPSFQTETANWNAKNSETPAATSKKRAAVWRGGVVEEVVNGGECPIPGRWHQGSPSEGSMSIQRGLMIRSMTTPRCERRSFGRPRRRRQATLRPPDWRISSMSSAVTGLLRFA